MCARRLAGTGLVLALALSLSAIACGAAAPQRRAVRPFAGCNVGGAGAARSAPAQRPASASSAGPAYIRVNQVGYPASCGKLALLMTPRRLRQGSFTVLDASGRQVAGGALGSDQGAWGARFAHVYPLDFSQLVTPGDYVLRADGAQSPTFRVDASRALYGQLEDNAISLFQTQRDGPNVIPGPLGRKPSHLSDAAALVYRVPTYHGLRLAGPLRRTGGRTDVSGGWFDAGDYLKFVETASFDDTLLLFTLRDFQQAVPGSAALRAEARFGTDWLLKMWDPGRQVLRYQVGLGDGNGRSVLGDHDLWRLPEADDRGQPRPGSPDYFVKRRPVFTVGGARARISPNLAGRLAGAFALCAQVYAASDRPYAQRCLRAGQTLYDRADTRPRGALLTTSPHDYYVEAEWRDDLELGATELYLATKRLGGAGMPHPDPNRYLTPAGHWADAYMGSALNGQDSFNLYDVAALAHHDLYRVLTSADFRRVRDRAGVDVRTGPSALLSDLRAQLRLARSLASRDPFHLADVGGSVDTVPHALGNAVTARLYDRLVGRDDYEQLASDQLNWVLGQNPWGSSFVVGAGSTFPHCLSHQVANLSGSLTGQPPVLLGATVDGPNSASNTRRLGAPDGFRRCPPDGRDRFRAFDGRGLRYLDNVKAFATSEPTDDFAALALLAFAQQAARR